MSNTHHFKRQNNKKNKIENCIILVMSIVLICIFTYNMIHNKNTVSNKVVDKTVKASEEKVLEVETLRAEVDLAKVLLDESTTKANRFVAQINNEIEYLTVTEDGTYELSNKRMDNDSGWWNKTFKESSITLDMDYKGIFSIKTSDIYISINEGIVNITYDTDDIYVKSVELSNVTQQAKKDWFGKEYSNTEVLALEDIAKEEIYKQLENDVKLKEQSIKNLNDYFADIANKVMVDGLIINGEKLIERDYNFIDLGTVEFNHPHQPLKSTDYIVIHSTACPDIEALEFYDRLNSAQTERGTSCHFYVDDINVVQTISTNLKSYNCGINNIIPCDNNSSLSIEICQFTDPIRQQKAIDNCVDFVNNVLKKQFPNAKIIAHRSVRCTACPSILSDEEFNTYFNNNK